jgi:hypothetical protein
LLVTRVSGGEEIRTPDFFDATEALHQPEHPPLPAVMTPRPPFGRSFVPHPCHSRIVVAGKSAVVAVVVDEVEVVLVDRDAPQLDRVVIGEHGVDDQSREHRDGVRHCEPDACERLGLPREVAGEQLFDRTQDPFGEELERRSAIG